METLPNIQITGTPSINNQYDIFCIVINNELQKLKKSMVGNLVLKNFKGHGYFWGKVIDYSPDEDFNYTVKYSDGDIETYSETDPELQTIINNANIQLETIKGVQNLS